MKLRVLLFCFLGIVVIVGGYLVAQSWLGWGTMSESGGLPARGAFREQGTASPPAVYSDRIQLVQIQGRVERQHDGKEWSLAQAGDVLRRHEKVRTDESGSATIALGQRSMLRLASSSEMLLVRITPEGQRLRLTRGRVAVDFLRNGHPNVLRIESRDGTVMAQTEEGKFSLLQSERALALATTQGTVEVHREGKSTHVMAGQQIVAMAGRPIAPPMAIPAQVFLEISSPRAPITTEKVLLQGRTTPGNLVIVAGITAPVDERGGFSAEVSLELGANTIRVACEDPLERRAEKILRLERTTPPTPVKVEWGKKKKLDIKWRQKDEVKVRWQER